jgi:NADH:ubiquinone oxidoreductase subunit 5 (subunit L)/multisubunit Na+/H+ antiporter MnhA subunit
VILTFLGEHKDHHRFNAVHESPWVMTVPLIVFAILSFFAFYSWNPLDAASGWFAQAVQRPESVVPTIVAAANNEAYTEAAHHAHWPAMGLSVLVASIGIVVAFATYYWKKIDANAIALRLPKLHSFLLNKWYFDELYDATAVRGTMGIANAFRWFDGKVIDGIVNGTARWTLGLTLGLKSTWEEGEKGGMAYRMVTMLLSLFVGWEVTMWLMPEAITVWMVASKAILGLATAGLTFFLFYTGVGGFDNKIVDGMVNFAAYLAGFLGLVTRKLQTGKVQTYLAFVLLGVLVLYLWF